MYSFGKEGVGFCLTAKRRTNTFVFPKKGWSGVGRRRQTLLRCHAEPTEVMGGVGEMRSVIAMIADRSLTQAVSEIVSDMARHEIP
jgi:hypothetical protein